MEWLVAIITIVGGVVTIVWFVRDIRKENSKILKAILDTEKSALEIHKAALEIQKTALEVQREQSEILARIEEGQRRGFQALEEGQRKGFQALEEGLKYLADIVVAEGRRTREALTK
ncbi:MAG: hypothetical protein RMJ13_07100 [Elusimicrobiota bacterium]|nr:hypothetical protein [Elusimicrobiota bacterium]